ncbi:PAS domain S-box protein [Oscillatoria sp. HE19RPO]|uniref:PAS domain S-box protein n=1 Tax=Oscillatoria sp. HE19RPO TaxID=2954806 RepID=UPI0020C21A88|nr:PAS domain S-box protein [Oscillatoria sp. HE19RPO]
MAKILIVDDDVTVQLVLQDLLESDGHRITVASDGTEGLRLARELEPDLIVCDWMMPGLDGLEVCQKIKSDPELAPMFFILLTAREEVGDRIKGLNTGADDFLSKPIETEEFLARVRAALRLHGLTQELSQANQQLEALVEVQRRLLAFKGDPPTDNSPSYPYTEILKPLGQAAQASRVYLCQNPPLSAGNCAPTGHSPLLVAQWSCEELKIQPGSDTTAQPAQCFSLKAPLLIERWVSLLARGEVIADVVSNFPDSERVLLEQSGIQSLLILPLMVHGEFFGFIRFDNCMEPRVWSESEVSILRAAAAAVSLHKERALAEVALRSSEARYRAIVEDQTELICRFAPDGTLTFVNDAYCRYFGVSRKELMDGSVVSLIPDIDRNPIAMPVVTRERRIVLPNGEVRWQQWTDRAIFDAQGVLSEFQAVGRDITEQKLAEAAVQASEERFRQLAENIEEVFWISDPDYSQILYVSPAYEEIWGLERQELYEQPTARLEAIHPDDRQAVLTGLMPLDRLDREYRIIRPDGSIRWIRDRGFPIRDEEGKIYRIAGISEDITEIKRAEEQLRHALAKEREIMEFRTRFVSMVSHEFRTPMTTILSSADLLEYYLEEWPNDKLDKKFQALQRIQSATVNMTQLLEDVLFIGRAEMSQLPFNPLPLDLTPFCQGIVEEFQFSSTQNYTINFVQNYSTEFLNNQSRKPCFDEKLLRYILNNLLSNAIKYSPDGGEVYFELTCTETEVIFMIKDSGIGIPSEEIPRLFQTFHRCGNVGNIPGTGLGLAMVKRSTDLHCGEISVESEVGFGTAFTVRLPLYSRQREEDSSSQQVG